MIGTLLYTLALRAFPRDHRAKYAGEMIDTFKSELAAKRGRRDGMGPRRFIVAAVLDAVYAGLGERRYRRNAGRIQRQGGAVRIGMSWLDLKLGLRMLLKYPGLSIAGGLALAIAIGVGAAWFDLTGDVMRPTLPLPGGDRIVEVEMRDSVGVQDERRILHDFIGWRRDARTIQELGAYRTLERNIVVDGVRPEPVTVAEITASAFELTRVPPLLGRPLLASDEQLGALPVVVIGYTVWQGRFAGRADVIGRTVQLGRTQTTVVGVMPEGYAFPINHRMWVPLQLQPSGYGALEGAGINVFGRLAPGATQAEANTEFVALVERTAAASPATHAHLRPRVLAYGGQSPGDRSWFEFVLKHLPILLVLAIACANVGTLMYARTATRDAEIAMRHALGASRGRIVGQLFAEALVLASISAVVGLGLANVALKRGMAAFYAGQANGLPFWINPGLKPATVAFAAGLTILGAALLGILPALKVTGADAHAKLKNLGAGGSTLRFGWVWTGVMVFQVALTVICMIPAQGISEESWRDVRIRGQFPTREYLAARVTLDRDPTTAAGEETPAAYAARLERTYAELERRIAREPGVKAVTFGDRLPGMGVAVRRAEVEVTAGAAPLPVSTLWQAEVGPRYFEAFKIPIVAGRDFHDGDRAPGARAILVNEAFARRYLNGASPVGRRVRDAASDPARPQPWLEIVGMVRDIGMTPTDLGEAPYVFRAASPATASPLVMGVRIGGDPEALAPRLRAIALELDPSLRLDDMRSLDDLAWRQDVPQMIVGVAITVVVALGLFLSAAGIFSLMSVSVARRTKEIGLRAALGASQGRLLAGIFKRAFLLIGSGIAAGNAVIILVVALSDEVSLVDFGGGLLTISGIMLAVGLVACAEPARRALRIQPTDALKEA